VALTLCLKFTVFFTLIAYNSASESIKHRLEVIQDKALRIACVSFCSTAAAALQVETGEMPLALRRSQQEIKYAVNVRATKNHPTRSVTEFHWTILCKKFKPNHLPLYSQTIEFVEEIKNVVVRSPALPEEPPWHQKPCSVDTALTDCGSKLQNPNLLRNLALEKKLDSYKNAVHIYTDASKTLADITSHSVYQS